MKFENSHVMDSIHVSSSAFFGLLAPGQYKIRDILLNNNPSGGKQSILFDKDFYVMGYHIYADFHNDLIGTGPVSKGPLMQLGLFNENRHDDTAIYQNLFSSDGSLPQCNQQCMCYLEHGFEPSGTIPEISRQYKEQLVEPGNTPLFKISKHMPFHASALIMNDARNVGNITDMFLNLHVQLWGYYE